MALEINQSNFAQLTASDKLTVIDFWAEWCGPCRAIAPIIDELATQYEGQVNIGKCDVDSNNEIAAKYGVRNIPTIIFVKNGELVDKQVGMATKAALAEKIDKHI